MALEPQGILTRRSQNKNLLTILEWKVRRFPACDLLQDATRSSTTIDDSRSQELFQLALLVYLERVAGGTPKESANMRERLKRAFCIFSGMGTMQRQFPLLILGCEARTDEERMVVLDLIARTEEHTSVRSLESVKSIIQSLWAQDDLAEREIDYGDKMTAVVSSSFILPSFA